MQVAVVGYGNIGATLVAVLLRWRAALGISSITVVRRAVHPWETSEMQRLETQGVAIHLLGPAGVEGGDWGSLPSRVDYVFHAGPNGSGVAARPTYARWPLLRGAVAQGSEKGFGPSYMVGGPAQRVTGERFVHIVSCNTHGFSGVLRWISGDRLERLVHVDAVAVRRSEDLQNHARLVGGPVIARHRSAVAGTHHATDAMDLFAFDGLHPKLTSSDVTTQGQLLHTLRFRAHCTEPVNLDRLQADLSAAPWLAKTLRFDGNQVFEQGRRHGLNGRLFAHAIIVSNNLLIDGDTVSGWAFVPQEGNTIGSTIAAYLYQTEHPNAAGVLELVREELVLNGI